jgi:hypothetical protein
MSLNGHVPAKLEHVPLETPGVSPISICKGNFHLPNHPAAPALDALNSQFDDDLLESKAWRSESPVNGPSPDHVRATTTGIPQGRRVLLNREPDLFSHVLRLAMTVSDDVQGVIQQACGHALPSFQVSFNTRKDQACPLSVFNYTYVDTG